MKELSTYINEKLDIDNVNLNKEFPVDGTLDEIAKFLEDYNYKNLNLDKRPDFDDMINILNKSHTRLFFKANDDRIRIADTSKKPISDINPILVIEKTPVTKRTYFCSEVNFYLEHVLDEKEFLKLLNKYLKL